MTTSIDTNPLAVGSKAPEFTLGDQSGNTINLSDYAGKNLIIVFYPKDQTPGCTQQLCALRDDTELFEGLNTAFMGSNPDSAESHARFAEKQNYQFPIVVDAERSMARDYHALKEDGQKIQRTVYIIKSDGIIGYSEQGLPSDDVLAEAIRNF